MKKMLALAVLLTATGLAHAADQNIFIIQGKSGPVGKCAYNFDKTKDGFKISSRYQAKGLGYSNPSKSNGDSDGQPNNSTLELQQTYNYKLDANYAYLGGSIMDNTLQLNSGYSPNKGGATMQLSQVQASVQYPSTQYPLKPNFIVMPNYDASAIQSLLFMATSHPSQDGLYYLIVPQGGKNGPHAVQAKWVTQPDATGVLNGKPIKLHHFSYAFGKSIYDVYSDEANTLMETDISIVNVDLIRNGFVLDVKK